MPLRPQRLGPGAGAVALPGASPRAGPIHGIASRLHFTGQLVGRAGCTHVRREWADATVANAVGKIPAPTTLSCASVCAWLLSHPLSPPVFPLPAAPCPAASGRMAATTTAASTTSPTAAEPSTAEAACAVSLPLVEVEAADGGTLLPPGEPASLQAALSSFTASAAAGSSGGAAVVPDTSHVEQLILHGADVNASDRNGWTPLHTAAYHGQDEIVRILLSSHADVNALNKGLETPLHLAAKWPQVRYGNRDGGEGWGGGQGGLPLAGLPF